MFAAPLAYLPSHDTALQAARANLELDFFVYSASFSFCRAGINPPRNRRKDFRRPLSFESPHIAHVGRLELLRESRKHRAPIDPPGRSAADRLCRTAHSAYQRSESRFLLFQFSQCRFLQADLFA